jgi:hypothetical protein
VRGSSSIAMGTSIDLFSFIRKIKAVSLR